MLWILIRKEILDHLLSRRFVILSAVGSLVVFLSLFSGYRYYQARRADFRGVETLARKHHEYLDKADLISLWAPTLELNFLPGLANKPPTALSIFVRGVDPGVGSTVRIWGDRGRDQVKWSPMSLDPLLGLFPSMDLELVVRGLLSLFMLLFTYDAICGEKEMGTLRMIASFPVSKDQLILFKLAGALVPTFLAFGLPMALDLLVLLILPGISFVEPYLLAFVLAAFGLYLTVFACTGILGSILVHRPSSAFAILLGCWVATVYRCGLDSTCSVQQSIRGGESPAWWGADGQTPGGQKGVDCRTRRKRSRMVAQP